MGERYPFNRLWFSASAWAVEAIITYSTISSKFYSVKKQRVQARTFLEEICETMRESTDLPRLGVSDQRQSRG